MSFKEPIPALSNVMDTNEHASSIRKRGARAGCGVGLYRPVTGALSSPDRAPSPTCPFIKNRRCQRADQNERRTTNRSPIYTGGPVVRHVMTDEGSSPISTGALLSEPVGDRGARGRWSGIASVRAHIWRVFGRVNAFLQFCCARGANPQKSAVFKVVTGARIATLQANQRAFRPKVLPVARRWGGGPLRGRRRRRSTEGRARCGSPSVSRLRRLPPPHEASPHREDRELNQILSRDG